MTVGGAALLAFLVFPVACTERPTTPSALLPPISQPPPGQPAPEQPPLTGPKTTYVFSAPLSYPVRGYTTASRYVLYDNGAFTFEYAPYTTTTPSLGVYQQENGRLSFDFGPNGRSDASGDLKGDLLEVRYTRQMEEADFENAVYRRSQ